MHLISLGRLMGGPDRTHPVFKYFALQSTGTLAMQHNEGFWRTMLHVGGVGGPLSTRFVQNDTEKTGWMDHGKSNR